MPMVSDIEVKVPPHSRKGTHVDYFLLAARTVCERIWQDGNKIEQMAQELVNLRERSGRLFVCGVGGSAANASHMVNDIRKLCHIEAYAPTDNVAELTARTNDNGWDTIFYDWLDISNLDSPDVLFILSVGGGHYEPGKIVSPSLVRAINLAKQRRARILGIVGRDGGYTAGHGDCVLIIPTVSEQWVTPLTEAFQALVWHALVSHPALQRSATKW